MNNYRLLAALRRHLTPLLPLATPALLLNLALFVLSLAQSPNCHLATLATVLPLDAARDNLVQRLRRWLKTPALSWERYYRPLVRQFLAAWPGSELALVMDRTDVQDRLSLLFVGIATRQRVVLLAWEVLPYGSTAADTQVALLQRIQPLLPDPSHVRITFFGDAEFRAVELQRFCQAQHWHWQVGVKSDTLYQAANGVWNTLRSIPRERGERRYVQHLILTQQHAFGPVNVIIDWNGKEDQPRYWVLDQDADRHAWRRGRKRFWIEPTNRDLKSAGFDLECSALPDSARLNNLVLAMAVTWLWMVYVGHWVIRTGRRPLLTADHKRDYSLFRLGRDWVRRALALGQPIPDGFTVGP
jgi:DDE family transposase